MRRQIISAFERIMLCLKEKMRVTNVLGDLMEKARNLVNFSPFLSITKIRRQQSRKYGRNRFSKATLTKFLFL